jgi:hypothetical protein
MEKAIYKHSTLAILLAHLVYSHVTGLDLPKAITAVFLIALHAYNKYLEKLEIPDLNKEFSDFRESITNTIHNNEQKTSKTMEEFQNSLVKYDTFIIKGQSSNSAKTMRF